MTMEQARRDAPHQVFVRLGDGTIVKACASRSTEERFATIITSLHNTNVILGQWSWDSIALYLDNKEPLQA